MEHPGEPTIPSPLPKPPEHKKPPVLSWIYIGIIVLVATVAFSIVWWFADTTNQQNLKTEQNQPKYAAPQKSTETPKLATEVVATGRDHVWEIAFLPSKEMLFTERSGMLRMIKDGKMSDLINVTDVYAKGEGGLTGLAIDPNYKDNHYIYTCFNSSSSKDIRVVRWTLKADLSGSDSSTPIITGIPANTNGRHSGCRLAFDASSYLWVGTGDTALGDTSIQPKSLGGKILRVDRDGKAAPGNVGGDYDSRIYSYGHRNVQGLAFYSHPVGGMLGVSIEHGSDVDDEVNLLQKGNFGWAPSAKGYVEAGVPMTDKNRFPDAIEAIWSSGNPTQAPSGATFVKGRQWKAWDGALVISMLKSTHLKVLTLQDNKVAKEERAFEGTFGRLRSAAQGPDGNLYISTDNGDDKIIRVIPD